MSLNNRLNRIEAVLRADQHDDDAELVEKWASLYRLAGVGRGAAEDGARQFIHDCRTIAHQKPSVMAFGYLDWLKREQ